MSQFLLLANPDVTRMPEFIKVVSMQKDKFFSVIGKKVFSFLESPTIAIVKVDGKDFDDIFVNAQREIVNGNLLADTVLYKVINSLYSNVDAMALWYASDYEDLDKAFDIKSLIGKIEQGLSMPSLEAYVLFIK